MKTTAMTLLGHYLAYLCVRLVICVVQSLPLSVCDRAAGGLASLFCNVLRIRHRVIEENLRHAYPDLSTAQRRRLAWRMWKHLFLFAVEVAHTGRKVHATNWHRYVTLGGEAELAAMMLDERPVIIVTAHYGNFELALCADGST